MSGVKGRSGRKPDAAVKASRAHMDEVISSSDWRAIWRALLAEARKGSLPAIKKLVEYRYGVASAQVEQGANIGVACNQPPRSDQPKPCSLVQVPHASADLALDSAPGAEASIND